MIDRFKRPIIAALVWILLCSLAQPSPVLSEELKLTMARYLHTVTGDFRQPSDVAVNNAGDTYVVDGVNHRIKVFSASGKPLFSLGLQGSEAGEFHYPLGIDLDGQGRLYVADSGNSRIQIFSGAGEYHSTIKLQGCGPKPADPTDIAVTRSGDIGFIADNDNHCILKYDLRTGKRLDAFGRPGIERKEFRYPFMVSLYNDKYLHIVDVINTRVQVLTDTGKFVTFVGDWGVEKGQFYRPKGVAVGRDGLIYVSDSYIGVIQVFTDEGHFHSVIGDPTTGKVRHFSTPVGLFVDSRNKLYVVEMFADKVTVFAFEQP